MWGQKRNNSKLLLMFLQSSNKNKMWWAGFGISHSWTTLWFLQTFCFQLGCLYTSNKLYEDSLHYESNNFLDTKYDFLSPFNSTFSELFAPIVLLNCSWRYFWNLNWLLSFIVWSAWKKIVFKCILGSKIDNQLFWNNYSDVVPELLTVVVNWNKVSLH